MRGGPLAVGRLPISATVAHGAATSSGQDVTQTHCDSKGDSAPLNSLLRVLRKRACQCQVAVAAQAFLQRLLSMLPCIDGSGQQRCSSIMAILHPFSPLDLTQA